MLALKLAAVPTVVWLASWAGRRWGHRASGWISGLPLIAAPIMLFLAMDLPRSFAVATAWTTMTMAPAVGVHCLLFAWLTRLRVKPMLGWPICLLAGWVGCVACELALSEVVVPGPVGAVVAIMELLIIGVLMPKAAPAGDSPRIPMSEIFVRMASALALATVITLGANSFGPKMSGILLGFPITASVLPVFTLVLYGPDSTIRLLAGFQNGFLGFVAYFFAFASVLQAGAPPLAAFGAGVATALAVSGALALWHQLRFRQEAT